MFQRFLFLVSLFLIPQVVFAHAHLKKSDPKANSVVNKVPQKIVLSFSEPLENAMSKVEVKDSAGKAVASGPVTASTDDPRSVEVALKEMKESKDTYEVSWKAVSKDTHKMAGSFKFTVEPKAK